METPAVLTVTAEQKHGGNALAASGEARARAKPLQLCPLFATLWTTACHAPLSKGFLSGKNTGEGVHAFLQGIFLAQGLKSHVSLCLLHWQAGSLP